MKGPRNLPASIQARLRNLATVRGNPASALYTQYALESLLVRLSVSPYRTRFVLKGAMLFVLWSDTPHRPTADLDLLGRGSSDAEEVAAIFRELCGVAVGDDGVVFDPASVRIERVREEEEYDGLRVRLLGRLGDMRLDIKVDIGFGDAVTPDPVEMLYPTLLGAPRARLLTYPRETVVAEKYQAMVALGLTNSRMKDFFVLWTLPRQFPFEGRLLSEAIRATFARRQTPIPTAAPVAFTAAFSDSEEKSSQWRAFLARAGLTDAPAELNVVVRALHDFLMPPTLALAAGERFEMRWSAGGHWTTVDTA